MTYQDSKHKKYYVVTPPFEQYCTCCEIPYPEGVYSDVAEVEAGTKQEAKVLGVRELRRTHSRWMQDQDSDHASPFTGLKVYEDEDEPA